MSVIKPSTQNDRYLVSTNKTKNNYIFYLNLIFNLYGSFHSIGDTDSESSFSLQTVLLPLILQLRTYIYLFQIFFSLVLPFDLALVGLS